MFKVFEVFQKYFTYRNPKVIVFWFMMWVTFDIFPGFLMGSTVDILGQGGRWI